ncbi:MAG: type II toxin-antitoxin system HicB family antitoxin [Lachnospiraceae bacterium]|nr:type II toxin-antitoxin system HicB family antitoxin [Lachnospiraceae bacterium]
MNMVCTVIITKEDDTYIAKDVRTNIADQGDTIEEALGNLKQALELYYDDNNNLKPEDEVLLTTSLEVCV